MYNCKYCNKEYKNTNALTQHEIRCKFNPNRIKSFFVTNQDDVIKRRKQTSCTNQYTKAKLLGLPKPICSTETRLKHSLNAKNHTKEFLTEVGKKISKTVREKVKNGTWHTSLAKRMHYNYNGINLHGKWELAYAKYLDANNIKWKRNIEQFDYMFENKTHKYTPDFYLIETNEYIEIKGYETAKDNAKWNQFPKDKTLIIFKHNELKNMNII